MTDHDRDPDKRHRHDVGLVDHGPHSTETVTRAIQIVLGAAILATLILAVYATTVMAR